MSLNTIHKKRRAITALVCTGLVILTVIANPNNYQNKARTKSATAETKEITADTAPVENGAGDSDTKGGNSQENVSPNSITNIGEIKDGHISEANPLANEILAKLEVKGRAPKTGYKRTEFYNGWPDIDGCNLRQRILKRDFGETAVTDEKCNVIAGKFYEPYTGEVMEFHTRKEISKGIQIDHVVALSDAWQKGAQYKTSEVRYRIATDPLNLIAVQAAANQQKSDGDAATWLPHNKSFRCQYVARQISVKFKYELWVTEAEKNAMSQILAGCPEQRTY
jgi:extracellular deoxyribonuclease